MAYVIQESNSQKRRDREERYHPDHPNRAFDVSRVTREGRARQHKEASTHLLVLRTACFDCPYNGEQRMVVAQLETQLHTGGECEEERERERRVEFRTELGVWDEKKKKKKKG
jgi:hypothetical protein